MPSRTSDVPGYIRLPGILKAAVEHGFLHRNNALVNLLLWMATCPPMDPHVPWTPSASRPSGRATPQASASTILAPKTTTTIPSLLSLPVVKPTQKLVPPSTFSVPAPHQTQAPSVHTSTETTLVKPIPSLLSLRFPSPPKPTTQATLQAPTLPTVTPPIKIFLCPGPLRFEPPKRSKELKECYFCHLEFDLVKRHAAKEHLPWWLFPFTACFTCGEYEGHGMFLEKKHKDHTRFSFPSHSHLWVQSSISSKIFPKAVLLRHPFKLLNFVCKYNISNNVPTDPKLHALFTELSRALHLTFSTSFTYTPPNTVTRLLHWSIVMQLLKKLSPSQLHAFRTQLC